MALLVCAPSALARPSESLAREVTTAHSSQSTNWAGYAVHRSAGSFRQVVGVWREPRATCSRGHRTFSSYWIGLGGYSPNSPALEQTGTEVDCTPQGHVRAFAWFELVPAPSRRITLKVPPGDLIQGQVTIRGKQVHFSLEDLTRQTRFSKTLNAGVVDVSSAEWIVEAPSMCFDSGRCYTLPLANFGSASFDGASVQPVTGEPGSILDPRWQRTRIKLVPQNQGSILAPGLGSGGKASPSGLQQGGSAFTVSYSPLGRHRAAASRAVVLGTGRLVHRAN